MANGKNHPTTLLLSVHKGASTFLRDHFAPAMASVFPGLEHVEVDKEIINGKKVEDLPLPPTGVVASRIYPHLYDTIIEDPVPESGRFSDKKLIMLRRDPRDVAVSLYFSGAYSHDPKRTWNPDRFRVFRERLLKLGPTESIQKVTSGTAIPEFMATVEFARRYRNACMTDYETLVTDFPSWMTKVQKYMGWTDEEASAVASGLEQELEPPLVEDPKKHKRRVKPGNWRDIFDADLCQHFEREIGPELREAGYLWTGAENLLTERTPKAHAKEESREERAGEIDQRIQKLRQTKDELVRRLDEVGKRLESLELTRQKEEEAFRAGRR